MADNLGTAAYKLVLDARSFNSSAVTSAKSMRDVKQVMRDTTTPAEKLAAKYDSVTAAYKRGEIPLKNYERYLQQLNGTAKKNADTVSQMTSMYGTQIPVVGRYVGMIGRIGPAGIAAAAGIGAVGAAAGVAIGLLKKFADISFDNIKKQFGEIDELAKASKATGFSFAELAGIERAGGLSAGLDDEVTRKALARFSANLGMV
ncbi:MAG TPA: hypothetical protein VMX74_07020, partial [Pirellulales bacterium]|nr:hypothetical protein [Pirellulales bacterium]